MCTSPWPHEQALGLRNRPWQCQSTGHLCNTALLTDASSGGKQQSVKTSHQLLADAVMKKRSPVSSALDVEHDEVVCWH